MNLSAFLVILSSPKKHLIFLEKNTRGPIIMTPMKVVPVLSRKHWRSFIDLPYILYGKLKNWVPPVRMSQAELLSLKHPVWATSQRAAFMVLDQQGHIVGRIMAIKNNIHLTEHPGEGHFGFFDWDLDHPHQEGIARLLLESAKEWLAEQQCHIAIGPVCPSTNYECGLLVQGFDSPPQVMMTYHPEKMLSVYETLGLEKIKDLYAYELNRQHFQMPEKILRIAERTEKRSGISYRMLDMKKWDREITAMFDLYNRAWESNWGFVPMSALEFKAMAKEMKMVVDPRLVWFVEVDRVPVGFIVGLPDLHQLFIKNPGGGLLGLIPLLLREKLSRHKTMTQFRILTMGVVKEYRAKGLATLLYKHLALHAENRFQQVEMSWILEDNHDMNSALRLMGASVTKTYRLFYTPL
jgi:GNAT superfamily N-acetyltransferase